MTRRKEYGQLIFDLPSGRKNIARYIWSIFTEATGFRLGDFPENPFIIQDSGLVPVSESFDDILLGRIEKVAGRYHLPGGLDLFRQEEPLACAFYLINSLHETLLPAEKWDKYERYPYQESIQYKNDLIETNYVQDIFDDLYEKITGQVPEKRESRIMWSHDIDYLYSAWKSDLLIAMQDREFKKIPKIIWEAITRFPRWNNLEKILDLEREYGINSTFFWLTEQGKSQGTESNFIDHADYTFRMKAIRHLWEQIKDAGSQNGLHKSAFRSTFQEELRKLPEGVSVNRNHFLRMQIPGHYNNIEKSGLKYDATLGFPEHYGFRNSFGRPFQPYNLRENRPYRFTELPLHLMDTTHLSYLGQDIEEMTKEMIRFINKHSASCTIGILLHNSTFNFQDKNEMKVWHHLFEAAQGFENFIPQ